MLCNDICYLQGLLVLVFLHIFVFVLLEISHDPVEKFATQEMSCNAKARKGQTEPDRREYVPEKDWENHDDKHHYDQPHREGRAATLIVEEGLAEDVERRAFEAIDQDHRVAESDAKDQYAISQAN